MLRIKGGGPRNALGHRPEPEVLPLPAETRREAPKCCAWQHQGGGPRNALGHRPEPQVLPLPAETRREAPKCCAWQHQGGGPRNALGHRPEPEVLPLPAEASREAPKCCGSIKGGFGNALGHRPEPDPSAEGGGPETRSGTVQRLKCCPCPSAAPGSIKGGGAPKRARAPSRA